MVMMLPNQISKSINGVTTTYTYNAQGKMSGVSNQAPSASVDIPLKAGWNLISLPLIPADTSIASVLAPIAGKYTSVWSYYPVPLIDSFWSLYDPARPGMGDFDLTNIEPDVGYYIYMTQDAVLTVSGSPITENRRIEFMYSPSWNLIGWPTIEKRPVSEVVSGFFESPELVAQVVVWGYDETDAAHPWKYYAPGDPNSELVEFEPGKGYWIYIPIFASLIVPAPAPETYHYDAQGRRQGSVVIYDGENQIAKKYIFTKWYGCPFYGWEVTQSYFQGPGIDNPISIRNELLGESYYYHTDALGSVTELTDASGNIVQSYRYDAFGAIIQESGGNVQNPFVENPFTYTGREYDPETGLYYYRARYYDAEVGRFLSRDTFDKHNTLSLYVYVKNSSPNYADPFGLQATHKPDKECKCCKRHDHQGEYCKYWVCRMDHCVDCPRIPDTPYDDPLVDDCQKCCQESFGGGFLEPVCMQECTNSRGCLGPPR